MKTQVFHIVYECFGVFLGSLFVHNFFAIVYHERDATSQLLNRYFLLSLQCILKPRVIEEFLIRKIGKVELLSLGCILQQKVSYNQKTTVNRCFPIQPNQPCFSSSQQATCQSNLFGKMASAINPSVSVSALMTLIDFTLSNTRRFSSSMGNPRTLRG